MYQRHQLGRNAANEGVAAPPTGKVFALARDFKANEGATAVAARLDVSRGEEGDMAAKTPEGNTEWITLVAGAVRWLVENVFAAAKSGGLPTVMALFCFLIVVRQQHEVQRLTTQLEGLLDELRDKIDE